jgi:hypothetical protein
MTPPHATATDTTTPTATIHPDTPRPFEKKINLMGQLATSLARDTLRAEWRREVGEAPGRGDMLSHLPGEFRNAPGALPHAFFDFDFDFDFDF